MTPPRSGPHPVHPAYPVERPLTWPFPATAKSGEQDGQDMQDDPNETGSHPVHPAYPVERPLTWPFTATAKSGGTGWAGCAG